MSDYSGIYNLIKNSEVVGSCVVMSENHVVFHLWKSLRQTRFADLKTVLKKYKLEKEGRK